MSAGEQAIEPIESVAEPDRLLIGNCGVPRALAAATDRVIGATLFFAAGISLATEEQIQILPAVAALSTYLGYFFVMEWLCGATPGKFAWGLRVRQLSGDRCTAVQIAIRTLMRIVDDNIILCGSLPAGIAILATKRRQRFGDLLAGTVVILERSTGVGSPTGIRVKRGRSG
jgi:uncharacterized RDD family membrane protein YckC